MKNAMTTTGHSLAWMRASLFLALASCASSGSTSRPSVPPGAPMEPSPPAAPAAASETTAPAMAAPPGSSDQDEMNMAVAPSSRSNDLDRAEHMIAAGDCATACRALGSMERAVALLCAQSRRDGDAGSCASAKARLAASRKHVRDSCGACPNGPSLLPDAPLPSSP